MENTIEKRAKSYIPDQENPESRVYTNKSVVSLCRSAYIKGANDLISEYNGVSPETVKELIEALRENHVNFLSIYQKLNNKLSEPELKDLRSFMADTLKALSKADKELKP